MSKFMKRVQHDEAECSTTSSRTKEEPNGQPEDSAEEPDPYANLSDYYANHPCAANQPYVPPYDVKEEPLEPPEVEEDEAEASPAAPFVPPSQRDDAPLAAILHPSLDSIDPRKFFNDFKPDGVLRFSRLFASNIKPSSRSEIWWPSKTFHKRVAASEEEKKSSGAPEKKRLKLLVSDKPGADDLQFDEELEMMRPMTLSEVRDFTKRSQEEAQEELVPPWRFGPAKFWYDMMNVPSTSSTADYGLKIGISKRCAEKKQDSECSGYVEVVEKSCGTFDDLISPSNIMEWEKTIVLDGEDVREKLLDTLTGDRAQSCDWIPTQYTRTYEHFVYAANNSAFEKMFEPSGVYAQVPINLVPANDQLMEPTPTHTIFASALPELDQYNWEEDLIWDPDHMSAIPEPKVLMVDFHDDPLIFGMPEDRRPDDPANGQHGKAFDRKFTKKSKMILGQVQQRQKQEEEEQMESSMAQFTDKDPFNLSNDDYYVPKAANKTLSGNSMLIQHSTPAQNIHRTFFPTHLNPFKLRHWHRIPLSRRLLRLFLSNRFMSIQNINRHVAKMNEIREKMKAAEGGGDIFFMRDVADLSGRDGDLVLIEYSEEHPSVLSQPGMAGKMRNYYKRKPGNDVEPDFDFGEMAFSHHVPFLGQLQPGQAIQSIENNLYRAPIYRHQPLSTDFLLIRRKASWYIRPCPSLFVAGQQCPLYEVPSPNSKRATVFVRDFLLAFIYRLFWASEHSPRRLKMEDIKLAFPHYAESSVRKRLKQCSDFKRLGQGPDQNYWILRPEFRLPTKEEVLAMVTPEMCCVQYSMLAAEQRLKDAGYGEKYFFTPENEEDSDDQVTIEDEIKCAPWNTTRAFLSSMRDKCLLDQSGIADPTGCGQGFSYVRVSQKPHREDAPPVPKRLVTGTNADLRKLPLKEAKEICREYGVKEEEINALTRWEIIDVIRTLSTQAAKAKSENGEVSGMARFARGNTRFNSADMQDKYKRHCQRIFDLQNQTLANPEALSTDDDTSGEDSDNEELANRLENMLQANKGKKQISMSEKARMEYENEERERKDLKRMIHGDSVKTENKEKKEATAEERKNASKFGEDVAMSASKISGITANQKLKIYRTVKNSDGTETTRTEVVTRPQLIEAYTRIRMTRDDTFIQVYAQMDEQYKEEKRKEKRRLQDQLRRIKRNEMKAASGQPPKPEKKPVPIKPNLIKMRCSACQGTGHMKTNKNCPLYGKDPLTTPLKELNMSGASDMDESTFEAAASEDSAKKSAKKTLFTPNHTSGIKKLKITLSRVDSSADDGHSPPPTMMSEDVDEDEADSFHDMSATSAAAVRGSVRSTSNGGPKRRLSMMPEEDYLQGPAKSVQRLRADPKVTMSSMLTEIVNELKTINGADHHLLPVNARKVPDYHDIVKQPMDLQKIKINISDQRYELRKVFLEDVKKMLDNSRLYNGDNHVITEAARQMFELACKRVVEREEKFINLEKQINPLLDDNDSVGFSHLLCEIVQKCKNIPKSVVFHSKVDARKVPNYYDRIKRPMDLGTIEMNAKQRQYTTVAAFRADVEQIFLNSEQFNGPAEVNSYTAKALEILRMTDSLIAEKRIQLAELEANINHIPLNEIDQKDYNKDYESDDELAYSNDREELNDVDMSEHVDDEEIDIWPEDEEGMDMSDSRMATSGQVINDLALSDSDDEEHLDDMRRPNDDDNLLDSF
ncbi:unnamed protein product [Caenorhabditis auriculariae]|uniref:Bromo domain-containing protein n=1 Tax=Caenorhabditis auriculariae TaxID=2777116 RepID=A0A8S1GNU1_9PELO|nr:unnamed protein product [Caenorhabditis auriculariae]